MIFWCTACLGRGQGQAITFSDIYREITKGTLMPFLESELGEQPIPSVFRPGTTQGDLLVAAFRLAEGYEGQEGKFLLDSGHQSGLCLVIALCTELIQDGAWDIGSLRLYDTESAR